MELFSVHSARNKICKQSKTQRTLIFILLWNKYRLQAFLVTVCLIILLCLVVVAKQPGRQTSVHSGRRICAWKLCGEQAHFLRIQNATCSLNLWQKKNQVSSIQLMRQMQLWEIYFFGLLADVPRAILKGLWSSNFTLLSCSRVTIFLPRFKLQALARWW